MATFNPNTIANVFIEKGIQKQYPLTPMQIVKLTYIAHGWYLAFTGQSLIDESVQAWKYGPVVSSVYHNFKRYGGGFVGEADYSSPQIAQEVSRFKKILNIEPFIEAMWKRYGSLSGMQLSTITHEKGTPWHTVWELQNGKHRNGAVIPNQLIRDHYQSILLKSQKKQQESA